MERLLSLSMIVRNEEKVLARALSGVRDAVDEIVVADTGSTAAQRWSHSPGGTTLPLRAISRFPSRPALTSCGWMRTTSSPRKTQRSSKNCARD